jgi:superfamily II DNA or RNA helicase
MIIDSYWKVRKDDKTVPLSRIVSGLTMTNPEYESRMAQGLSTKNVARFFSYYSEQGEYYLFPRGLANIYMPGRTDYEDKMVYGKKVNFKSRIKLRDGSNGTENQTPFAEQLHTDLTHSFGTIGQAGAGFGKTVCSLHAIAKIGVTTLIVVHKEFLVNQWVDRIQQYYDIDREQIGIIQQDRCEYEGKAIVVALVQSLLAREYPADMYEYFGALVFDEVHRFGAPSFRETIPMFRARYRLGVSATPKRKDNLQKIFFDHIGEIGAIGEARKLKAKISRVKSPLICASEKPLFNKFTGRPDMNKIYDLIAQSTANNKMVIRLLIKALDQTEGGRQIIVFSHRREHLNVMKKMFEEACKNDNKRYTSGFYVGGMKEKDLTIAATRNVLFATYQMAKEGLDIETLNTAFMVTPIGKRDVEQTTGRILRDPSSLTEPMVLDFRYAISVTENMAIGRENEYRRLGYKIT